MKIAYFDCFSGISGDMCLGALVDAGVSLKGIEKELGKIPVKGYRLESKRVKRSSLSATKVNVILNMGAGKRATQGRRWKEIEGVVRKSSLTPEIKQKGLNIFRSLFEAEAKVHGTAYDKVHLHELGAVDCIVDIFGTLIGLKILGIEKVYASPVNLGQGFIMTSHGILPVPAPATVELLKKIPLYSLSVKEELTTPTGAALLKGLSSGFGEIPLFKIENIGTGAGDKKLGNLPNVLRILIGEAPAMPVGRQAANPYQDNLVTVIETNIDDMNPQIFEYVMERLFDSAALDVFLTQVIMKKGRPGVQLTVICKREHRDELIKILMEETSTIGVRFYEACRKTLRRDIKTIDTEFGKVRIKTSKLGNSVLKISPEYDDCKKIAERFKKPLRDVLKKIC
jgi:pyridinium-3,5-bisthiocarboxylic acid mononucleotide nickel chelatase